MTGLGRGCTYTQQTTTQPKHSENNVIHIHADGNRNSYTKQNMSQSDRLIPWDAPSLWNLTNDTNEPLEGRLLPLRGDYYQAGEAIPMEGSLLPQVEDYYYRGGVIIEWGP